MYISAIIKKIDISYLYVSLHVLYIYDSIDMYTLRNI